LTEIFVNFFNRQGRGPALLIAAAVWLSGCLQKSETIPPSTVTFGTLTDERDGKTYKTVKIGNQTWMAENLNYNTSPNSPSMYCTCYKDSASYCDKYGRLYAWDVAKKACPTGWKLPDMADWNRLITNVGGEAIAGD
jgi:hypothetical protein